jgi:hypothetical protein
VRRFKDRVREITRRVRGRSIHMVIGELNRFLTGWRPYYQRGMSKALIAYFQMARLS